jgi:hypothetical protein
MIEIEKGVFIDAGKVDLLNPSDEDLLRLAGGTVDMVHLGKAGVELRSILAQRVSVFNRKRCESDLIFFTFVIPRPFTSRESCTIKQSRKVSQRQKATTSIAASCVRSLLTSTMTAIRRMSERWSGGRKRQRPS